MAPCHTLIVNVGGKNVITVENSSYAQLNLYFPPRITVSQEIPLYTTMSLVAEIGGYLGLTLGVSVLEIFLMAGDALQRRSMKKGI